MTPRDIYGNIRTGMDDPVSASIDVNAGSATLAPEVAEYVGGAGAVAGVSAAEDYKLAFRSLLAGALVVSVSVGSGAAAAGPARHCLLRHPTHYDPSFLDLYRIM